MQTWSWHGGHQWGLELAETVRSHIRERMSDQKEMDLYALQGEREGWLRQQWWAVGIILAP